MGIHPFRYTGRNRCSKCDGYGCFVNFKGSGLSKDDRQLVKRLCGECSGTGEIPYKKLEFVYTLLEMGEDITLDGVKVGRLSYNGGNHWGVVATVDGKEYRHNGLKGNAIFYFTRSLIMGGKLQTSMPSAYWEQKVHPWSKTEWDTQA